MQPEARARIIARIGTQLADWPRSAVRFWK
eukprot:COSAG06_NODE_73203_length_168_cov_26.274194_1_plen_29_part_01